MELMFLDLACGENKTEGAFGVDIHPFKNVDLVTDLDKTPWPFENDRFDHIVCKHFIEHVTDVLGFMKEVHRIAQKDAILEIVTPHFSSIFSWNDPTHLRHLSLHWYKPFVKDAYLASRVGVYYEFISSTVNFGGSIRASMGKMISRFLGPDRWERDLAFSFPARDIRTLLRVIK